jgi:hypothetical protein
MKLPQVGEHWQEQDPRHPRTVEVLELDALGGRVKIRAVEARQDGKAHSNARWAKFSRFNGKRGGYAFVPPTHES